MGARLIAVPYDSGNRNRRMGRGPLAFLDGGAARRLAPICGTVIERVVEHREGYPMEVPMTFELQRGVAAELSAALDAGEFPLLLAGNCHNTVGAVGGYASRPIALAWFDAHGDLNTPETTASGFMDGMPLAMVSGRCWRRMTATIPGFRPLPDERLALVGARDFDPAERELLAGTRIPLVRCEEVQRRGAETALAAVLDSWSGSVAAVHVHVDLDVHDPRCLRANSYQPGGGLSPDQVRDCVRAIAARLPLAGGTLSAYDPATDPEGTSLEVGLELLELLARLGCAAADGAVSR